MKQKREVQEAKNLFGMSELLLNYLNFLPKYNPYLYEVVMEEKI